jgi:thioredoxin-like negative regulator of GroEL
MRYLPLVLALVACNPPTEGTVLIPKTLTVIHSHKSSDIESNIKSINAEEYAKAMKSSEVMIEFYAPWCQACKEIGPVMDAFHAKHPELPLYRLNTDDEQDITRMNDVVMVPIVKLYHHGISMGSLQGGDDINADNLERLIHTGEL